MLNIVKKLWRHKLFFSVALSETGGVRGVHIRAFWPVSVTAVSVLIILGLLIAGENARAKLASSIAWDSQASQYLATISKLKEEKETQSRQVALIAQELGVLQARIERFDVIGEKLSGDEQLGDMIPPANETDGKGGPEPISLLNVPSIDDIQSQIGILQTKADRAETALNTGLSLAILNQKTNAGVPYFFPVLYYNTRLTSPFGWRKNPFTKKRQWHGGTDISGTWNAPIVASADGVVIYAGYRYGYGMAVEIRHANGFTTRYGHMKKTIATNGQAVKAGDLIGLMGSSGRSTGPHLHFEVLKDGEKINPYPFIRAHLKTARRLGAEGVGTKLISSWKSNKS